jgi:hypothetical protein
MVRASGEKASGAERCGQAALMAAVASDSASCSGLVSVIICTWTMSVPATMLLSAWEQMSVETLATRSRLEVGRPGCCCGSSALGGGGGAGRPGAPPAGVLAPL